MLQIGDWQVDPALDEIRRDDQVVKLEPRMMRLLCCLAERPGEVWSANALLEKVWPGVIVNSGSVYQVVASLRKSLGDDGPEPRYIATVPRKGYRLIAPVREATAPLDAVTASDTPPASEPSAPIVVPTSPSRRRVLTIAALTLVAIFASLAVASWLRPETRAAHVAPALVVLPLTDLSADGSNAAFCDGLTDELLNALGRVSGLRVTGRTSAFRARADRIDTRELGKVLGVTHVLEGSVRATRDRLRVSAQLVSTADGFQVWSNSFDRPRSEALNIQSEISRAVVGALALRLTASQNDRLQRQPTTAVNAYELYLLGRHQQLQRTPESISRAVSYQQQAIAADPGFALAHAGLADAYMAGYHYQNRPLAETEPMVQREVDEALRLDPELAEGYVAWGILLLELLRNDEALRAFKRAISINSNHGVAWLGLATTHEFSGRPYEALKTFDQVATLDPLNPQLHIRRCNTLQNIGRYSDAERACQRAFDLQPDVPNAKVMQGLNAYTQGDLATAIERYTQALTRSPRRVDVRSELGMLYLDIGLPDRAAAEFETARVDGAHTGLLPAHARRFVASGDHATLARELRAAEWSNTYSRVRLDAAYLATIAQDTQQADALLRNVFDEQGYSEDDLRPAYYPLRWGVCEMCSLAYIERLRGDVTGAERHEAIVLAWLKETEANGYRWHSLHYARAVLQSQRGESEAALTSLERAVDMGWRRAWLMRADPALEPLRKQPRFKAVLQKIDALNAQARERLLAATQTSS